MGRIQRDSGQNDKVNFGATIQQWYGLKPLLEIAIDRHIPIERYIATMLVLFTPFAMAGRWRSCNSVRDNRDLLLRWPVVASLHLE